MLRIQGPRPRLPCKVTLCDLVDGGTAEQDQGRLAISKPRAPTHQAPPEAWGVGSRENGLLSMLGLMA